MDISVMRIDHGSKDFVKIDVVTAFWRCGNRICLDLDDVVNEFPKHHEMWYLLCDVVTARCREAM